MHNWQKLKALPFIDQSRLVGYVLLLPLIRIGLSFFGYRRNHAFLASHPRKPATYTGSNRAALGISRHTAYLVSIAARQGLLHATCLHQALLTYWLLRKIGIETQVNIGVQNRQRKFLSHAWLEYDGEVVLDDARVKLDYSIIDGKQNS